MLSTRVVDPLILFNRVTMDQSRCLTLQPGPGEWELLLGPAQLWELWWQPGESETNPGPGGGQVKGLQAPSLGATGSRFNK